MLNHVNRTSTRAAVHRYKVEPYVVAADVYAVAPHVGRGGWTWYTGSAGWMYRAGLESILGVRVQGATLQLAPCLPASWPSARLTFKYRSSRYDILIDNTHAVSSGVGVIEVDGTALPSGSAAITLVDDGNVHRVRVQSNNRMNS